MRVAGVNSDADMGELGERIQPLYISVDPKRDTPEVMRMFLEQKYPKFLGLTGSVEESESCSERLSSLRRTPRGSR
jgi:cytochrome oxidase Cu insertion factor (SCO1/SenC/PrrC family)